MALIVVVAHLALAATVAVFVATEAGRDLVRCLLEAIIGPIIFLASACVVFGLSLAVVVIVGYWTGGGQ